MEIKGIIQKIGETETFGANGFQKRQLILETQEQYPQQLPIDFVQNGCDLLDDFGTGREVTIGINLRGNEHNGKHYCNIQGWKIS